MTIAEKAIAFRKLHEGPGAFVMPNPWDVGTARVLAGLGFPRARDDEWRARCRARPPRRRGGRHPRRGARARCPIAGGDRLPVSGDLENGYGHDPESVAETIRGAAAAGLVGCSIEDSTSAPGRPISVAQAVERIAAAAEAAAALPFPFTLTARAENYLHGRSDLDDTIERLQAFDRAGADVLYAPGAARHRGHPHRLRGGFEARQRARAAGDAERRGARCGRRSPHQPRHGVHPLAQGAFLRAAREVHGHGTFGSS